MSQRPSCGGESPPRCVATDARQSKYDGVAIILARVAPTLQHGKGRTLEELKSSIESAFGEHAGVVRYGCMGRQDVLVLVRTRQLDNVGRIWRPRGVRKMDIQYGYMPQEYAERFFANRERPCLVLAMYAKLDDTLVAQQEAPFRPWELPCFLDTGGGSELHVVRTLGWNDALILVESNSLKFLGEEALKAWEIPASELDGKADRPLCPRTYSIVGYLMGDSLAEDAKGFERLASGEMIPAPRVEMRIRPGRAHAVADLVGEHLNFKGSMPNFALELGHEDGTVTFEGATAVPATVDAREFLTRYYGKFLPAVSHYVHSTQLCLRTRDALGTPSSADERAAAEEEVKEHVAFPYISLRDAEDVLVQALQDPITASSVDCLHALYEACDWSIENEVLGTTFGDLFWHLRWLLTKEWKNISRDSKAGLPDLGRFAESLGLGLRLLGDGFSQRLGGAYYGIMGYQPEHLFSHTMSLHKIVVGLWALHTLSMRRAASGNKRVDFSPQGCWVVSYGQRPAVGTAGDTGDSAPSGIPAGSQVAQVPSRGIVALETMAVAVAHECGHMLYNAYLAKPAHSKDPLSPHMVYDRDNYLSFHKLAFFKAWTLDDRERQSAGLAKATAEARHSGVSAACRTAMDEGLFSPTERNRDDLWRTTLGLARECFADAYAIKHLLGDRFDLYALSILKYLAYHGNDQSAWSLLQRAYVMYCHLDEDGPSSNLGIIPEHAIDKMAAMRAMPRHDGGKEEQVRADQWPEECRCAPHNLASADLWQCFRCRLSSIGIREGVELPDGEVFEEARMQFAGLQSAGFVVASLLYEFVADAFGQAPADGDPEDDTYKGVRRAFQDLAMSCTRDQGEAFDARVECIEELWHAAIQLLTGDLSPTSATGKPPDEPPWKQVFERARKEEVRKEAERRTAAP